MSRRSGLNFGKQRRKLNVPLFMEYVGWVVQAIAVVMLAYVITTFWGTRTNVVGQAMEKTLEHGDSIFLDKFVYVVSNPKPGDVVVFLPNGNDKSHYYVRRVIGVPGDTVQIRNGVVYINGERYDEKITVSSMEEAGIAAEEITLGDNEYFVLGDNRNDSEDSRYANIGNIKKEYIVGKAWFCFNSLSDMEFIH